MNQRHIPLEGAYNLRDIGGYSTLDGKKVKLGKLYRSDELSRLTENDIKKLEEIGLRSIVDFRGAKEKVNNENVKIANTTSYNLDPISDVAALASSKEGEQQDLKEMIKTNPEAVKDMMIRMNADLVNSESSKKAYKALFELIQDEQNLPLVQHCRGGKDRTGFGVALILLVLGVDKDTVFEDYLMTNTLKREKIDQDLQKMADRGEDEKAILSARYLKEAHLEYLETALTEIENHYGNVETYIEQELNVSKENIERLKELLLED